MWNLHTQLHPEMFPERREKPTFFEGWYFKAVSADEQQRYAIIPRVILGANGHAFLQVLNGSGETFFLGQGQNADLEMNGELK